MTNDYLLLIVQFLGLDTVWRKMSQVVTLRIYIRKVPGSNRGRNTEFVCVLFGLSMYMLGSQLRQVTTAFCQMIYSLLSTSDCDRC